MTTGLVVCADWSAGRKGRAAWAADVVENTVFRLDPPVAGWTVASLLDEVDGLRGGEPALVCFDAPIGVPASFLTAWGYARFPEWLADASFDELFVPVDGPEEWSVSRPFVRPRKGGWTAIVRAARAAELELWRVVDRETGAESMFKLIGAKQVGRAAQELWRELREARVVGHVYRLWPFEADLDADGVVVAEIYPRTAYEEVLKGHGLVKSELESRASAVRRLEPEVRDAAAAAATDDDFDAAISAVALLRRMRNGRSLADPAASDSRAEGGILCT